MLAEKRVAYLRVDGTLPIGQRKRILTQFQAAEQGMVLLMTLGTGAIGYVLAIDSARHHLT